MEDKNGVNVLSRDIRNILLKEGASLVSYADIKCIPLEVRQSMDYAISIGVALNPDIMMDVWLNGPTIEYSLEKVRLNKLLNHLAEFGAEILRYRGFNAIPLLVNDSMSVDMQTQCSTFPHKTVATMAGLGWIGKSALLVTEEFGPALRINTILTEAVLDCSSPIEVSRCGECVECMNACPGQAVSGNLWDISKSREDIVKGRDYIYNIRKCMGYMMKINEELGIDDLEAVVCGVCIAACPRTKRYFTKE
jgi:epoxyqueuosine reductase QueG